MAYQIGATSGTLVNASTVFYGGTSSVPVYLEPQTTYTPGGERVRTETGTDVYVGYPISTWHFADLAIVSYRNALAILVSTLGTGTITAITSSTNVDGTTTAFNTELQVSDVIAAHRGSGVYEVMTVASITDADTLNVTANPANAFTGVAFRYRRKNIYSSTCYVQTRNDLDYYQSYYAIARFPKPDELERSGSRYLNVKIEFALISLV